MRGMIFCAGLGERLRPLTARVAKPAVRFLNVPMLGYPLFWLEQLGLDRLVINTHYLPGTVEAAAESLVSWAYELKFVNESPDILGSGGAIWNARDLLSGEGDFVTANADAVMLMNRRSVLREMLESHRRSQALATLLVCEKPGAGVEFPGVWMDARDAVVQFGKGQQAGLRCLHFAGIMIFSEDLLSKLPAGPSNILYDVLLKEIGAGARVNGWVEPMYWYETGRPEDYLAATKDCLDMLFTDEGARWHLVDILDRFSPGWRNYQTDRICAFSPPSQALTTSPGAAALLGKDVRLTKPIQFIGPTVVTQVELNNPVQGVFVPEAGIWV